MTDITALAQRLKTAAEKSSNGEWVKESGDGWEAICSANDQANEGFIIAHLEGPDAAENREFIQAANPVNALALVEALEKAQTARDEYEASEHSAAVKSVEMQDEIYGLKARIAELEESHAQVIQSRDHYKRMTEEGLKQLAESRTVTVKLPEDDERDDLVISITEEIAHLQRCFERYRKEEMASTTQEMEQRLLVQQIALSVLNSAAGIKAETNSVNADVSDRNQPGMVVAVHIDAGDFVKFRGQVYEVKETEFDDHDVTLWFVCGETLKCAAGCQLEVISAPEEAE